jgi:hypothetical protein
MMTTATITPEIHKSSWGFHPCDRETCKKLKEGHRLLLRAYCDVKRYIRWDKKDTQNQGQEPVAPKDFIEYGYHRLDKREFYGYGFRKYGRDNLYLHVLHQYQRARRPVEHPVDVAPLDLPHDFDKIVEGLREFYAE